MAICIVNFQEHFRKCQKENISKKLWVSDSGIYQNSSACSSYQLNYAKLVLRYIGYISWYLSLHIYCSILFYPITMKSCWGTTDDLATIAFHLDLLSAVLLKLAKCILVYSLILFSNLFSLFFLYPMPCRVVFAKPEDLQTRPNNLSFLTTVKSLSYSPMASWIFLQTSAFLLYVPCKYCSIPFSNISSQRPVFSSLCCQSP